MDVWLNKHPSKDLVHHPIETTIYKLMVSGHQVSGMLFGSQLPLGCLEPPQLNNYWITKMLQEAFQVHELTEKGPNPDIHWPLICSNSWPKKNQMMKEILEPNPDSAQWATLKPLGISYLMGKIEFKLLFHGPLARFPVTCLRNLHLKKRTKNTRWSLKPRGVWLLRSTGYMPRHVSADEVPESIFVLRGEVFVASQPNPSSVASEIAGRPWFSGLWKPIGFP